MRPYYDPITCDHRLLLIYLGVMTLDYINRLYLAYQGFHYK